MKSLELGTDESPIHLEMACEGEGERDNKKFN
jgi:hypothetical protein